MAQDWTPIYLAHRETYAAFLTAADAEARVDWHRWRGEFTDRREALARTDAAYTRTQAAFNMIDLEGVGPVEEAAALVACVRSMHIEESEPDGIWESFTAFRAAFVQAARRHLADHT